MAIHESRLTQRVLNTLADEGVIITRESVATCVEKATETPVGIQDEDLLHDKLVSVFKDTSELQLLGESVDESGGILLTDCDESIMYGR